MGLIDFVKNAGAKISDIFDGDDEATPEEKAQAAVDAAADDAKWSVGFSKWLKRQVTAAGLEVDDLEIIYRDGVATLKGTAADQATREKVVLMVGNVEKIGQVDDQLDVRVQSDPAIYYTVVKGDTLGGIATQQYGIPSLYPTIYEANRPMLGHPDEIFPGQVLRIPVTDPPTYTVKPGDTLGGIAAQYYGKAKFYTYIFEANRDTLTDPNKIKVGQTLVIPLVPPAIRTLA